MTSPFGYNLKIVVQNWRFSASYLMDCRRSARASKKIFVRFEIQLQSCWRVFHLMLIKSAISYKHGREGRLPPKILIYAQCLCKKPTKFPWNLELIQLNDRYLGFIIGILLQWKREQAELILLDVSSCNEQLCSENLQHQAAVPDKVISFEKRYFSDWKLEHTQISVLKPRPLWKS